MTSALFTVFRFEPARSASNFRTVSAILAVYMSLMLSTEAPETYWWPARIAIFLAVAFLMLQGSLAFWCRFGVVSLIFIAIW